MRNMRAVAVFVGALIIGVLGVAYPAQATGKVGVSYADDCRGVTVKLTNPLRGPVVVKVTGHDGDIAVEGLATSKVTLPAGDTEIQASLRVGRHWVKLGDPHVWKFPKYCPLPPVITATAPTCESPELTITVANASKRAVIVVRFNRERPVRVGAGKSVQFTATADVVVSVNGKRFRVVKYVPPKDCPTPEPTPEPTPTVTASPEPTGSAAPEPTDEVPPPNNTPQLPVTGAAVGASVAAGLLLAAGGGGLLLFSRRRRATFAP